MNRCNGNSGCDGTIYPGDAAAVCGRCVNILIARAEAAEARVKELEAAGKRAADAMYHVLPMSEGERVTKAKELRAHMLCDALAALRAVLKDADA